MSDNTFEESFDLKSILDEEEVKYRENSTHYFLDECPNCSGKDKVNIDKKSKLWVCWACVKTTEFDDNKEGRGNLWTLLLTLGFDEDEVRLMFKGKKRYRFTDDFKFERMDLRGRSSEPHHRFLGQTITPYAIPKWLLYLDRDPEQIRRFPEVYTYLWNRHVRTKEQYQRFMLYYDPAKKRVVFPAVTKDGVCIGSQSRDITDRHKSKHPKCNNQECDMRFYYYFVGEEEATADCYACGKPLEESFYPKSLNSRDFPKTEFFFNEQNTDWSKPVVLVEGPFDAINVDNSLAFLGKVLSDTQFNILLEKRPPKIVLYLDGDIHGDNSTTAIYNQLRAFFDVTVVYSEDGDDPGSHDLTHNASAIASSVFPYEWCTKKGLIYI